MKRGNPNPYSLINELREVHDACQVIKEMAHSVNESDRLFYNDVRPWLLKLEAMTAETIARLEGNDVPAVDYNSNPDYQFEILGGMGEHISLKVLTAEPSSKRLMPCIEWLRNSSSINTQ